MAVRSHGRLPRRLHRHGVRVQCGDLHNGQADMVGLAVAHDHRRALDLLLDLAAETALRERGAAAELRGCADQVKSLTATAQRCIEPAT